jgi:hypothetical protein
MAQKPALRKAQRSPTRRRACIPGGGRGGVTMQMYTVQLGKTGADGFREIESSRVLTSNLDGARQRAIDLLKTRGPLIGANKALMYDGAKQVFEFP